MLGSNVSSSTVSVEGILESVNLGSRRLGSLIGSHFLIYLLQVELFQVHSRGMLNEVSPQKLKPLEVLVEKYSVVLLSLLKALDNLGYNPFDPLLGNCKLLVFHLGQLLLNSKLFSQTLELFLGQVGIVHGNY